MADDISKKTIFAFMVLTIVVSVISTFIMLESVPIDDLKEVETSYSGISSGRVALGVRESPEPAKSEGMVTLTVK